MKRICPFALVLVALFAPTAAHAQKAAKESDLFFKSDKVLNISIDIGPKELEALRRDQRKYVKATLKDGDVVYANVGVHLKGAAGSFRGIDDKPGLTINMNKYEEEKLFHGMDKFHLANSVQDPSYLSELICGEMFRAAGVPASRVHHALVTVNGKKRGLYYIKEGYDKYFLKRHFGTREGNLYDGGFLREIDQPLQLLGRHHADVKPHTDLKALTAAARIADPKQRFEKMEKVLDMDKFLSYLALEVITWDWDGYPMNRNNYRIYHDPKRDKLVFIPSGMDQMYGNPGGPIMPGFQGMVSRAVMETPEGKKRYLARLAEINKSIDTEAFAKRLTELQGRVQPALASIDKGAGRDYPNQVNRLREAIRQRSKSVEQQLKTAK